MTPSPIDYVNTRQGTDSTPEFSTGNVLPLAAMPFGSVHWSPQTEASGNWFFSPRSRVFRGIRATHQPSPWMGDYGCFLLLPQTGELLCDAQRSFSSFRPERLELSPDRIAVFLERYQCSLELIPAERGAAVSCHFQKGVAKRILLDCFSSAHAARLEDGGRLLLAKSTFNSGGVPPGFAFHAAIRFNCRVESLTPFANGVACEIPEELESLDLRIGTSFISPEQALLNLKREIEPFSRDDLRAAARNAWNGLLSKVEIDASERRRKTFYSCLYRCFLFPRALHEFDAGGAMLHWSPYDGQVHPGPLYADNGFWDTHRTVYHLFSLVLRARCAEMLEGYLNAAREGGWLPRWCSPGYRACMIGTHLDAVFADALAKGVPFNFDDAWKFLLRDAFDEPGASGLYGRQGLGDYLKLGFVPSDRCAHAASRTMDYAYCDFAVAQLARRKGDLKLFAELSKRSLNYRNVFDKEAGFMRGRKADGSWEEPFSQFRWGGAFIEGSAWQCGWAVPHDVEGLAGLLGGKAQFIAKLDRLLATPPLFETGDYKAEIHEMSEMAAAGFGQCAHSNQPSHHIPWLYAQLGEKRRASELAARIATELYTPDALPGDEDNGEMSAWYVFATLGFYPLCPGKPEYAVAAPLCGRASIETDHGTLLVTPERLAGRGVLTHEELLADFQASRPQTSSPQRKLHPRRRLG